jgi:hypothetical protein
LGVCCFYAESKLSVFAKNLNWPFRLLQHSRPFVNFSFELLVPEAVSAKLKGNMAGQRASSSGMPSSSNIGTNWISQ